LMREAMRDRKVHPMMLAMVSEDAVRKSLVGTADGVAVST
jgi:hypothetical protein